MPTDEIQKRCTDCRDKPRDERGSGPCLSCGKPTRDFDSRVYYGVHGPFCCVPCRNRWVDADIAKARKREPLCEVWITCVRPAVFRCRYVVLGVTPDAPVPACAECKEDMEAEAELRGHTLEATPIAAPPNPGQLTLVLAALAMVVAISCGGSLPVADQPGCETVNAIASGTVCQVCAGVSYARIADGPDGWCDYDGRICACHGHGVGDRCDQLVAEFDEACR